MPHPAPRFESPAANRAEIWRIVLGAVLIILIYGIGTFGMVALLPFLYDIDGLASVGSTPFGARPSETLFLFATFIPALGGIALVVRSLHRRRLASLFGPAFRTDFGHFKYGMQIASIIAITGFVFGLFQWMVAPETVPIERSTLMVVDWMLFLLPIGAVIFIQIAAEELFFRGYLLQHLMARTGKFWIAAIVPSVIFGLGHFDYASFGINAWFYVMTTAVGGVILCSVTLRTGNIGAALGLHFANNIWATVTVGLAGNMDGMSLWIMDIDLKGIDSTLSFVLQTGLMVIAYLIWRRYTQERLG